MILFQKAKIDELEPVNVVNREVIGGTAKITSDTKVKHDITTKSSLPSTSTDVEDGEVKMASKGLRDRETNLMEDKEKNVVMSSKQPGAREMDADSTNVDSKHDMTTVEDFDYYDEIRPVTEPSIYDSGLSSASQVSG